MVTPLPRLLLPLLACALTLAGGARAEEGAAPPQEPPAQEPTPPAPTPQEPPPHGGGAAPAPPSGSGVQGTAEGAPPPKPEEGWIDLGHAFVEQRIFAPVLRLDRFFSDERDIEVEREHSFLRWRSEVRFEEPRGSRPALTTGVRANLRLPGLNRRIQRLRIVVAGETRDAISSLLPREGAAAAAAEDIGSGDAGLRYYLWDSLVSHADLGAGILVRLPPGTFGRLRLRWAVPIRKVLLARAAVSGFWRSDTEFGTSVAAELERPITPKVVSRLAGTATLTERSHGIEWGSELALLVALHWRTAGQIGVAVTGTTDTDVTVIDPATGVARTRQAPPIDRYRVYNRLRRDVYRRWLFLEVEPGLSWPWSPERGRHPEWAVALRLEVQFQGKEAPPAAPPPAPSRGPEPKDPADAGETPPPTRAR